MAEGVANRTTSAPLPRLDAATNERLLVRYDRLSVDQHAWMRLSVATILEAMTLEQCLRSRKPGTDWQPAAEVEALQISGKSAARIVWKGPWMKQDFLCENVAVRRGGEVYFLTASFPAADTTAREQVRQAVGGATLGP